MTKEEFLVELKNVADEFTWHTDYADRIRGTHKNSLGFCGCPLTCVIYAKTNKVVPTYMYNKCAKELNLPTYSGGFIACCADFNPINCNNLDHKNYRQELLKAVNLAPQAVNSNYTVY